MPGENPWRRASENATYQSPKIQAPSETRTCIEQKWTVDYFEISGSGLNFLSLFILPLNGGGGGHFLAELFTNSAITCCSSFEKQGSSEEICI